MGNLGWDFIKKKKIAPKHPQDFHGKRMGPIHLKPIREVVH